MPGDAVLINGASGGVGTFAVQIAKALGAEVTAVCSSGNIDTARAIGADHVVDYTREDFARNGRRYDVIVAVNGHRPIWQYLRALRPGGTFVASGGSGWQTLQALFLGPWLAMISGRKMRWFVATPQTEDLVFRGELLEAGKLKPVIDRRYALHEVPDAIRYLEEGHARGKVVIAL